MRVLSEPWPWYIAGPLIGLLVPTLLVLGNRQFGVSGSLRALCAAVIPAKPEFFRYDWKSGGGWSLTFVGGAMIGGFISTHLLGGPSAGALAPAEFFSWSALLTARGFTSMVVGGFLVGFGTAYAGGCTSGHGITGLATLQLPSLIAVMGFFAGGLVGTWLILPLLGIA